MTRNIQLSCFILRDFVMRLPPGLIPKAWIQNFPLFITQLSDVQVINAARVLAARPKSKVAQENMDVFKDAWINQVQ